MLALRGILDVISDVNLCYSEFARKYLADTGLPKERTYMTGSPMAEVLRMNLEKIEASDVLDRLGLEPNRYILLSAHREENIDMQAFRSVESITVIVRSLASVIDRNFDNMVGAMVNHHSDHLPNDYIATAI